MIENPDKVLKVNACITKCGFFPVKHEEPQSASTLNFMPLWSFSEFGFQINNSFFKKTNFMPAQEVHICYCIYVWNSFENWHMVVELSVANTV